MVVNRLICPILRCMRQKSIMTSFSFLVYYPKQIKHTVKVLLFSSMAAFFTCWNEHLRRKADRKTSFID